MTLQTVKLSQLRLSPLNVRRVKAAADNCAKMKKGELAAAAAERMAGRGWLPPALVIAEPEPETEDAPVPFEDGDGDGDSEDEEGFGEAEAA